jgi:3D (Asp-Asp-Asp) domain-containing protein
MAVRTEIYTLNYADEWYNGITASGYTLPTQATIIAVSPGSLRTGVNFSLQKGGGISGNVTAAGGTPIVGEEIDVYDSGTNWIRGTETGAGGTYQAIGLATQGLYYVRTSVGSGNFINEWFDDMPLAGSGIPPGATGVRVPSGSVTGGVDFVLQRGGTLFGRVSDGADSPLTGIGLALYTTAGVWRASAETGVGGYYQMSQITPDTYYLRSDSGGLGFVDKWYQAASIDGSAIPIDAQPLALTANGTNQADLTLGFMIVSAGKAPDEEFSVRWQAASGTVYQVEWTTDFTVWTNAPAGSNDVQQSLRTAPAQSVLEYSVPTSTNMAGNYRVQIVH